LLSFLFLFSFLHFTFLLISERKAGEKVAAEKEQEAAFQRVCFFSLEGRIPPKK